VHPVGWDEQGPVCVLRSRRYPQRSVLLQGDRDVPKGLFDNNKGLFSEVLVHHDDDALYFECRSKDSGVVRYSFEMLETLTELIE
jgi:hypothetical protein